MATRIKEKYINEAVPALQQKFGYKNVMEIPKLSKIVINMGAGDHLRPETPGDQGSQVHCKLQTP